MQGRVGGLSLLADMLTAPIFSTARLPLAGRMDPGGYGLIQRFRKLGITRLNLSPFCMRSV